MPARRGEEVERCQPAALGGNDGELRGQEAKVLRALWLGQCHRCGRGLGRVGGTKANGSKPVVGKAEEAAPKSTAKEIETAKAESNAARDMPGFGSSVPRESQPGTTFRAENVNAGQVTDRDGLPRVDGAKDLNDKQVAAKPDSDTSKVEMTPGRTAAHAAPAAPTRLPACSGTLLPLPAGPDLVYGRQMPHTRFARSRSGGRVGRCRGQNRESRQCVPAKAETVGVTPWHGARRIDRKKQGGVCSCLQSR